MQYFRKEIAPGVGFNAIKTDVFKSEYMSVYTVSPLSTESASYNSLLCNTTIRGCEKYPSLKDISRLLDRLYDSYISPVSLKRGEYHIFGYSASSLKSRFSIEKQDILARTLDLLYEIMCRPLLIDGAFSDDIVQMEKSNLISAIEARVNDRVSYVPTACVAKMCEGEPFAVPDYGIAEVIKSIDPTSLYEYSTELYKKSRIEIFYVGDDEGVINGFCEKLISSVGIGERLSLHGARVHSAPLKPRRFEEKAPVTQSKLALGFNTGRRLGEGRDASDTVFFEIFSSSPSSRLFKNVREKLSLCYYCKCNTDPFKGISVVSAGIRAEDAALAEAEILAQLKDLSEGNISQKELDEAKKTLLSACREIYDSPSALINWYLNRVLSDSTELLFSPDEQAEKIRSVTVSEVAKCAERMSLDTVYLLKEGEQ